MKGLPPILFFTLRFGDVFDCLAGGLLTNAHLIKPALQTRSDARILFCGRLDVRRLEVTGFVFWIFLDTSCSQQIIKNAMLQIFAASQKNCHMFRA